MAAERLTSLTYENRLRVVGRQLDLYAYRAVNLFEVGGGFLVRALLPGSRVPDALEFPDRDFLPQVEAAIAARGEGERLRSTSPLLPTGYEDFLRALGHRFDQRVAEAITVSELDKFIAVGRGGQARRARRYPDRAVPGAVRARPTSPIWSTAPSVAAPIKPRPWAASLAASRGQ